MSATAQNLFRFSWKNAETLKWKHIERPKIVQKCMICNSGVPVWNVSAIKYRPDSLLSGIDL